MPRDFVAPSSLLPTAAHVGASGDGVRSDCCVTVPRQSETCRFFRDPICKFTDEDHVAGRIGETEFEFSEVHARYQGFRQAGSRGEVALTEETIFRGLFFVADFNKHFNKLNIAMRVPRDMFEARLTRSLLDLEVVREYAEDLLLVTGIVDDLNLNNRIWTKE